MNEDVLNKILFKERFNNAIIYLEMHDQITLSTYEFLNTKSKKNLTYEEMQLIIDLVDSIKFYDSLKREKHVVLKLPNISFLRTKKKTYGGLNGCK